MDQVHDFCVPDQQIHPRTHTFINRHASEIAYWFFLHMSQCWHFQVIRRASFFLVIHILKNFHLYTRYIVSFREGYVSTIHSHKSRYATEFTQKFPFYEGESCERIFIGVIMSKKIYYITQGCYHLGLINVFVNFHYQ